jgi:hypothetical protein
MAQDAGARSRPDRRPDAIVLRSADQPTLLGEFRERARRLEPQPVLPAGGAQRAKHVAALGQEDPAVGVAERARLGSHDVLPGTPVTPGAARTR